MSEAAFLAALSVAPEDELTPLVYADWLDDQGDAGRASFLRLQAQVRQMTSRTGTFRARCRRLRALGEKLDAGWVGVVSRPALAGTCWSTSLGGRARPYIFRYLAGGELNYTSPTGTFQNGTWRQVGPVVLMEMNNHYADYVGLALEDRIGGSASNITGARWRWDVARTTSPELCDPGDPDRTVYHHGPRRRRRRP